MGCSGAIALSIIAAGSRSWAESRVGTTSIRSNFNGTAIASDDTIWPPVGLMLRQMHAKGAGYRGTAPPVS